MKKVYSAITMWIAYLCGILIYIISTAEFKYKTVWIIAILFVSIFVFNNVYLTDKPIEYEIYKYVKFVLAYIIAFFYEKNILIDGNNAKIVVCAVLAGFILSKLTRLWEDEEDD